MAEGAERWTHWLEARTRDSGLELERVPINECHGWSLRDGALVSDTGGFFTITGLVTQAANAPDPAFAGPMIDQPEIGRLGFLIRPAGEGVEWLLQAKTEPGNHQATQIAPSIQATPSNFNRLHGGLPTVFLDLFRQADTSISDGFHSEQGSKFIWKFNRNQIVALPAGADPAPDDRWRWAGSRDLRQLLGLSYTVNTDARSVIATGAWALLGDGAALFRSPCLARSYAAPIRPVSRRPEDLLQPIQMNWTRTPLDGLPGRTLEPDRLAGPGGETEIVCFRTRVRGREVAEWRQPFLTQSHAGEQTLAMRIVNDKAEVFARILHEPGFGGRSELGPTVTDLYPTPPSVGCWFDGQETELLAIDQSDEGGRFFRTCVRYRIVLVKGTAAARRLPAGMWLSLSEFEVAARTSGVCTNELRTLASLMLSAPFDEACLAL
ncbi:MAG: hypothetical protein GC187_09765 [Alphaproteobacteria bacterium]|nr:hypothetical protein [Alphaproteobacteria bacterium]